MKQNYQEINYYRTGNIWLEPTIVNSLAFGELTKTAIKVLLVLYGKRIFEKKQRRAHKRTAQNILNNGDITFPYSEAKKCGISNDKTFSNALKKLLKVGFIDINVLGGYPDRATTFYISERWRKYGTPEFIEKEWPRNSLEGERKNEFLRRISRGKAFSIQ